MMLFLARTSFDSIYCIIRCLCREARTKRASNQVGLVATKDSPTWELVVVYSMVHEWGRLSVLYGREAGYNGLSVFDKSRRWILPWVCIDVRQWHSFDIMWSTYNPWEDAGYIQIQEWSRTRPYRSCEWPKMSMLGLVEWRVDLKDASKASINSRFPCISSLMHKRTFQKRRNYIACFLGNLAKLCEWLISL
jgi:hypothetical protein